MVVGRNEGLMLGRDAEIELGCEDCSTPIAAVLVGIVGAPGLGKSRLIARVRHAIAARQDAEDRRCRPLCSGTHRHAARSARCRLCCAPCSRWTGLGDADARDCAPLTQCGVAMLADTALRQPTREILFDAMAIADADAPPPQVSVDGRRRRLVEA